MAKQLKAARRQRHAHPVKTDAVPVDSGAPLMTKPTGITTATVKSHVGYIYEMLDPSSRLFTAAAPPPFAQSANGIPVSHYAAHLETAALRQRLVCRPRQYTGMGHSRTMVADLLKEVRRPGAGSTVRGERAGHLLAMISDTSHRGKLLSTIENADWLYGWR